MLSVRLSVPTFQNLAKQNKFQAKTMFTTGKIMGMAEWIIDYTSSYTAFFQWGSSPIVVIMPLESIKNRLIHYAEAFLIASAINLF